MATETKTRGLGIGLDAVTNIVLIAVVLYSLVAPRWGAPEPPPSGRPDPYILGEQLPKIDNVDYSKAKSTLVVFVRSGCIYCKQSAPFYRDLLDSKRAQGGAVQVVAVSLEDQLILDTFLKDYALEFDQSATIVRSEWDKLWSTPTLIAVNSTGIVLKSWVGQLDDKKQQDVRATLGL